MMSLFAGLILCSYLTLAFGASASSVCSDRDLWSYNQQGTDPPNWGKNFPLCKREGNPQPTPIDINTYNVRGPVDFNIRHNYRQQPRANTYYTTKNEGRTIKMDFGETDYYLEVDCRRFKPLQVHIHFDRQYGSEHAVNGKKYPAEIHIVHKRVDTDNLLVIGVFVESVRYSYSNSPGLDQLLYNLPNIKNPFDEKKNVVEAFPLYDFLPFGRNGIVNPKAKFQLVNYIGSLTTPGCNGDVEWYVVTGANLKISPYTLRRLAMTKDCYGESLSGNFRDIQPIQSYTKLRGSNSCL